MMRTSTRNFNDSASDASGLIAESEGTPSALAACQRFAAMARVNRALAKAAGDVSIIWNRGPIILSRHCVAQPDLAVLRLREDGYSSRTPTVDDVLLVVEIAGMEVPLARLWKARLYAAAGVPECWTLDNIGCRMEIHCLPEQKTYRLIREVGPSDAVQPRMLAGCSVRIADLLLPRTYNQKSRG